MTPYEAITANKPNVWLTSFYGFDPSKWGFLGFTNKGERKHFLEHTKEGALVVIYGHKSLSPKEQQGKVIGILQMSRLVNNAKTFMHPSEWAKKEGDRSSKGRWDNAIKATRAWKVVPESYVQIDDFAEKSYTDGRWQHIGSYGVPLTVSEAAKILELTLIETNVYGQIEIDGAVPVLGKDLLQPSKAGPVSQNGYFTREAEGPKQNYILTLDGDANAFLGYPAEARRIVKVGMSVSPPTRRDTFNTALPVGAYSWSLLVSNELDGRAPYESSKLGLIGEKKMKEFLVAQGISLGGEFFLASDEAIAAAWAAGQKAVQEYSVVY